MLRRPSIVVVALLVVGMAACKKSEPKPALPPPPPPPAAPPPPPPDPNVVPAPSDVKAPPADAEKLPSGLVSKVLVTGAGSEHPTSADAVKVHYTGWTPDGKMFKNTLMGAPEQFDVGKSIKGWIEGLPLMVVGEKRRFWIPAALTGGASATASPGASAMVFDVELLEIEKAAPVPVGALAQPKDVQRTKSGLVYKVLKKGAGKYHPKANNTVEVHYTGWTHDGKEYDSSVKRGRPAKMLVTGVFPGWAEALPLLVVGDKARFWFPAKLAFGEHPPANAPAGGMVFDIELLGIE
jgi:FKBP-type peptidyl-prolyl cis-trans isomerase